MEKKTVWNEENLKENICSAGIDLSLIETLVKFLDTALNDELNISHTDTANLTVILKNIVNNLKEKYEKLEHSLNV